MKRNSCDEQENDSKRRKIEHIMLENYEIVFPTVSRAEIDLNSSYVKEYFPGEVVQVIEIREVNNDNRIRAKLQDGSWISLERTMFPPADIAAYRPCSQPMTWAKKTEKTINDSKSNWCDCLEDEIIESVRRNDILRLKTIVENNGDINLKSRKFPFDHPICEAAERGNIEILKFLLENGADVNQKTNRQKTPIMMAVFNGQLQAVEILFAHGAVIDLIDGDETILMIASMRGHSEIVNFLAKNGADVNAICSSGTALMWALTAKQFKTAKLLLEHNADPNIIFVVKNVSLSPLVYCMEGLMSEAVELLLNNAADPNLKITYQGIRVCPLSICSVMGNLMLGKMLFCSGAKVNSTINGQTYCPLETALVNGYFKYLLYFLEHDNDAANWFKDKNSADQEMNELIITRILCLIEIRNVIVQTLFPKHHPVIAQIVNEFTHGFKNLKIFQNVN